MKTEMISNPLRGKGLAQVDGLASGDVETDARAAIALYQHCPVKHATPVESKPELAKQTGVGEVWLKLEILQQAVRTTRDTAIAELGPALGVELGFNSQDGD